MSANAAENAGPAVGTGDAPGKLLGAAREEQNLSVAEAARQLKLSVHQVEALEAGEFHKLPGPVFVRGFIRNYARLLKLDPEQLAIAAAQRLPHEEPRPAAPPSQDIPFPPAAPRRWPIYAAIAVAVLAALAVYEFYLSERVTVVTRPVAVPETPPAAGAPRASAPEVPGSATPTPGSSEGAGQAEPPQAQPAPQPAAPRAASRQGAAPAAPAAQSAPTVVAAVSGPQAAPPVASKNELRDYATMPKADERQVHMIFDQESWVQIRDRSGKAIFSQLNRRGTEQRVNGRPPLAVVVGNAPGVRFTYNDQPVDLARHTSIDVARFNLE